MYHHDKCKLSPHCNEVQGADNSTILFNFIFVYHCTVVHMVHTPFFVCFTDGLTARFSGGNVYSDGMLLEEGGYLCVFVYLVSLYFPLLLTYLSY